RGHKNNIWSFVFLHDNIHIVSGSLDGTMRKWNYDTGLLVGQPWERKKGRIYALALSPDGKTISCGRDNGSVEMWNTDGEMSEDIWTSHSSWVFALSWSPSGGHIASGSSDGTILIRKAGNGEVEPEVGPIKTQQGEVRSLAYSHSGDRIASGGYNRTICIWNTNTGELLVGPIKDLGSWVESVVWSLDDSKLYSTSDKFARVFDSTSGTELHRFEHDSFTYSVALSPKRNALACAGFEGVVHLWGTESHQPLGLPFSRKNSQTLRCLSFSRDGRYLACSGHDNKITLWMWDCQVGHLIGELWKGHEDEIWSFVFLHDNVHIVSSDQDGTMRKWDCDTGLLVGEPWASKRDRWKGKRDRINALALSPDGKTISCGRSNGSVEMWNTDGEMSEDIWTGHSSSVRTLSWSPSGGHIASGSSDGTILIRKAGNGEVVSNVGPIKTQQGRVYSLAYSHLGDRIASGGDNKTICIWN
ncbi:WD40 repeat-like protein, partial [Rhizopogon vinicolor AM-OR11-026]